MISGLIVYNGYDAKCNRFFINMCLELLNDETFSLKYVDEEKVLEDVSSNKVDLVIYRGRNYLLLEELVSRGIKTFNNVVTNKTANDKYLTYEFLEENNLSNIETYLEPKQEYIDLAIKASKALGLDFAGVDVMFGTNDEPIICELNSNPQFASTLQYTGVNLAEVIADYILNNL